MGAPGGNVTGIERVSFTAVPSVKDHEATLRASGTTDQAVAFRDLEEE